MNLIRSSTVCNPDGTVKEIRYFDIHWPILRKARDEELTNTDWRAVKDRTMSQEWIDYRQFLRDLPQNYFDESDEVSQGANAAADAWNEYPKPE